MHDKLIIRGAREHNLKNVDLSFPKNTLTVFTGLSGSGKSSLAFDTIYAEGQRRYVESLSSYARQFLGVMDKPDVDNIEGLSPAISIDQKSTSHNPRSTVGTITEIYDYLRLLFARVGHPHCPNCGREIERQSPQQISEKVVEILVSLSQKSGKKPARILVFSPVIRDRKGEFTQLFENLKAKGFTRVRIDGKLFNLSDDLVLIKTNKHSLDVVVDRISAERSRLKSKEGKNEIRRRVSEAIEQALTLSEGLAIVSEVEDASFEFPDNPKKLHDHLFSQRFSCPVCNISIPEIEPRVFSFNSPHGACQRCSGIGALLRVDPNRVLNKNLSIAEGGILPFARLILSDTWYGRVLLAAAESIGVRPQRPLKEARDDALNKLLHGTGDREYEVAGENRHGRTVTIYETFSGIVPELERRYSQTESEFVRHEIGKYLRDEPCPDCLGKRLKKDALSITIDEKSIVDITELSTQNVASWITASFDRFNDKEKKIATMIVKEISSRLSFLTSVGLTYLTLGRPASSLSGGEAQRIRLASQIGSGLSGVLYVLDEPSIGLHPRDNSQLIHTLKKLRDLGNTLIVVEHDREMMEASDLLVDIGPGAGKHGGKVLFVGTVDEIKKDKSSLTGAYLSNRRKIELKSEIRNTNLEVESGKWKAGTSHSTSISHISPPTSHVTLKGCSENNLKSINVSFPLGKLICITGVSGSGKSTLVVDTLYGAIQQQLNPFFRERIGKHVKLEGIDQLKRAILIDQSPIGRTPRSNPATYTGAFTFIRDLFSMLPESKARGYSPGRFSFNVRGGRCEACEGEGEMKIEMQFLPDVYVMCDVCQGSRFNTETLEIRYKGKSISGVLKMTVEEALKFFEHIPGLANKLETLSRVGLSYIELGQPAPQLSGGEAQRIKLASELSKTGSRNTLYILDEPTTGLHFADLEKLLHVLSALVSLGNTVVIIEHNLDIIKNSDWIIDLGPEGGDGGGFVISEGTPKQIAEVSKSYTGQFLRKII